MKKYTALFIAFSFLFCSLTACTGNSYEDGYSDGYSEAKDEMDFLLEEEFLNGYDFGCEEGYFDASQEFDSYYDEGYDVGYSDGYDEGHSDGYDEGHSDGYYAGATYVCLYYKDIDRAFQCAKNGISWDVFIESYDQYISNIYDSETTKSELFWAFISLMVSQDAKDEEIELLTSTFGKDLFVRNGITLLP